MPLSSDGSFALITVACSDTKNARGNQAAYILRSAESNTGDSRDMLQAQLANGFPGLLLVAGVDGDGGATGDGGLLGTLSFGL